jgi:hypothetical protein
VDKHVEPMAEDLRTRVRLTKWSPWGVIPIGKRELIR